MIDKTTEGYAATTDEIEGMLRNLCAYALSEPDPLERYIELTHQQVLFDGLVAAIRRERGKALADMMTLGAPAAKVAELTNLESPAKVKSLITAAGVPVPTQKAAKRPSRAKQPAAVPAPRHSPPAAQRPATPAAHVLPPQAPAARIPAAQVPAARVPASQVPGTRVPAPRVPAPPAPAPAPAARPASGRDVVTVAESGPIRRPAVLPPTVAVNAKRTLTPAERAALGLPATGSIPQKFSRDSARAARSR